MLCRKVICQMVLLLGIFSCLVYTRSVDEKLKRSRRQAADVKLAEYRARVALERYRGCEIIGCGLIDLVQSGKKKRDGSTDDAYEGNSRNQILKYLLLQRIHENRRR